MIKAVLQAIPTHHMSRFKISKKILDEMNRKMSKILWGNENEDQKIHWSNWATLCEEKFRDVCEFKDLNKFNLALLAKLGWRLMTQIDVLWARLMKGLYDPNKKFLSTEKWSWQAGIVCWPIVKSYVQGCANRWVMVAQRKFGRIHGSPPFPTLEFNLQGHRILTSAGCQS